jgi:hypothetical protein
VSHDGGGVAGEKVLVIAHTHDERRAASGADQDIGVISAEDGDAVGAGDLFEGGHDGLGERVGVGLLQRMDIGGFAGDAVVMFADDMGEDLGVG